MLEPFDRIPSKNAPEKEAGFVARVPSGVARALEGARGRPALSDLAVQWTAALAGSLARRENPDPDDVRLGVALTAAAGRHAALAVALEHAGRLEDLARLWGACAAAHRVCLERRIRELWPGAAQAEREAALAALASVRPQPGVPSGHWELLEDLGGSGAVVAGLRATTDWWEGEEIVHALSRCPEALETLAPELVASGDGHRVGPLLLALSKQTSRWAADFVGAHAERLIAAANSERVLFVLARLGAISSLRTAVDEWRPGEPDIAQVAVLLGDLANSPDAVPKPIRHDYDSANRDGSSVKDKLLGLLRRKDARDDGSDLRLPVSVRCNRCARVFRYEVPRANINPRVVLGQATDAGDGVLLYRVIECKRCGAMDEYTVTPASLLFLAGLAAHRTSGAKDEQDTTRAPVTVVVPGLWDGSMLLRPTQGLRHLRALAERDPTNGEGWRRLGNLHEVFDQMDEAEEAWAKAVEADPRECEAAYSLAKLHWDRGSAQEAVNHAQAALERLPRCRAKGETRLGLAGAIADMLRTVLSVTHDPVALEAVWRDRTVGRQAVVNVSSVDLRTLERWDRLGELLASEVLVAARLVSRLPEEDTILGELLASGRSIGAGQPTRKQPKVGPNDPCACGSGRKHKKCCGKPGAQAPAR
jgi:tetratricopeptide (TPR) repeat protein